MPEQVSSGLRDFFKDFVTLGFKVDHPDEGWVFEEEPHVKRRQAILKAHPEVKKLMGYDPFIVIPVLATVALQFVTAYLLRNSAWQLVLLVAYVVGATCNHSLGAAIHEIGHNLAFGHKHSMRNRALGIVANLPWGIPMSVTYKKYHADHHRYMGHDTYDVDIPTAIETYFFKTPFTKILWLLVHPIIHGLRPFFKNPVPLWNMEIVNTVVQLTFDFLVVYFFGITPLAYFMSSSFLGQGGLHWLSGHFFSEHYLFAKGQATQSYYGIGNFFMYNLGYHVEHHDFPYIPFRKLPELKKICPEFYDDLPCHTSWAKVIWDFVWDSEMGPHARGVGYLPQGKTEDNILQNESKKVT